MSKALITESSLTAIANAIRAKNGGSDSYTPGQMAGAIMNIPQGITPTGVKQITRNGTTDVSEYASAAVNVPNTYAYADEGKVVSGGALVNQTSKAINYNGTHNTTNNNQVNVNVPNTYTFGDEGKVVSNGALANQTSRTINANGTYNTTNNNQAVVNVPNSYAFGDEGKVVSNGALVNQTPRQSPITANGTYQTKNNSSVVVDVPQTGSSPVLIEKSISANGTYDANDDNADGYTGVTVNVPNSYRAVDEGKVVSNGALVSQTSTTKNANGTYDTTGNNEVVINVPNTYGASDDGKVVDDGALVTQTSRTINANGTVDTTTNNEVVVYVPNSYSAGDEGMVVDNGELVEQTSTIKIANGTYDTTTNNEVVVDVPNSYDASDEGKVVSSGELVAQTSLSVIANGTYDTTENNSTVVNVPNTYTAADDGKVVDDGELVEQTSLTVTENGTVDTTTNNEVVVAVPAAMKVIEPLSVTRNGVFSVPSGVDGYSPVTVNVSGSGQTPHIIRAYSSGSYYAGQTINVSPDMAVATKTLFCIWINGDTDNKTFDNMDVEQFVTYPPPGPLPVQYTERHEYTSTGDNQRNYRICTYNVTLSDEDYIFVGSNTIYYHTSYVTAFVSAQFEIGKIMTSADAATSGSFDKDGCVLYGTLDDNMGGTIVSEDYTANTTITTDDPGSGYQSSFIIWLTKPTGSATLITKTITQNGTYDAEDDSADGYSSVVVNVQELTPASGLYF